MNANRQKQLKVLRCLKAELAGQSVSRLLDGLRGRVDLPKRRQKGVHR